MSLSCSFPDCKQRPCVFCDCSRTRTYLCVLHLSKHTSLPGVHRTKKLTSDSQPCFQPEETFNRCEGDTCGGLGKFFCACNNKLFCCYCLESHLLSSPNSAHSVEVRHNFSPSYADLVHPLDLFLKRTHCDPASAAKIKNRGLTVREILSWDMRRLAGMAEPLGLNATVKLSMWEEINYIRVVTERTYLKNEYMARLIFGLEEGNAEEPVGMCKRNSV
jgi:hypothetical protein